MQTEQAPGGLDSRRLFFFFVVFLFFLPPSLSTNTSVNGSILDGNALVLFLLRLPDFFSSSSIFFSLHFVSLGTCLRVSRRLFICLSLSLFTLLCLLFFLSLCLLDSSSSPCPPSGQPSCLVFSCVSLPLLVALSLQLLILSLPLSIRPLKPHVVLLILHLLLLLLPRPPGLSLGGFLSRLDLSLLLRGLLLFCVCVFVQIVRWECKTLKCLGGERVVPSQFGPPHRSSHSTSTTFFVNRSPMKSSRFLLSSKASRPPSSSALQSANRNAPGRFFIGGGGVGLLVSPGVYIVECTYT